MSVLTLCFFGTFQMAHDARPHSTKITRSLQNLLAYLLLYRQQLHPREVLVGLFWGEQSEERARGCLSTALWRLRKVLEPEGIPKGTYLVATSPSEVGFNTESDYWFDVEAFEEDVVPFLRCPVEAVKPDDAARIEKAFGLYRGELLEGFYDDWALTERERLRCLHLDGLIHLMRHYSRHRVYERAIFCGCNILNKEPLREGIQRDVMRLFVESGQRERAISQYKSCCRVLNEELGIAPMEETRRLYQKILNGSSLTISSPTLPRTQTNLPLEKKTSSEDAVQILCRAIKKLERSSKELQRAIQLLEGIVRG